MDKQASIFDNLQLLVQDKSVLKSLNGHAYVKQYVNKTDSSKSKTNKDVFIELAELAIAQGIHEANFSLGLYNYTQKSKSVLKEYSKSRSGFHNKLATGIIKDELYSDKPKKQLVLIDDINFIDEKSYGYRVLLKKSQLVTADYMKSINKVGTKKLKDYEIISVSDLVSEDYGKLMELRESMTIILNANKKFNISGLKNRRKKSLPSGTDIDLYILCPELWMTYEKYDLESIDYVSTFSIYFQPVGLRLFQAIYPLYIYQNIIEGSPINQYWLTKTSFTPFNESPVSSVTDEVHYKINKHYYTNSFYYLILD